MSAVAIDPAQRVAQFDKHDDVTFAVELENGSDQPISLLDTRRGGWGCVCEALAPVNSPARRRLRPSHASREPASRGGSNRSQRPIFIGPSHLAVLVQFGAGVERNSFRCGETKRNKLRSTKLTTTHPAGVTSKRRCPPRAGSSPSRSGPASGRAAQCCRRLRWSGPSQPAARRITCEAGGSKPFGELWPRLLPAALVRSFFPS